jgi:DNA-3-methyladenine glycosylase
MDSIINVMKQRNWEMSTQKIIKADFFDRETVTVAQELLGCLLVHKTSHGILGGYIVETEAYLGYDDPACHSFRGKTKRNEVMFKGSGFVYIYMIYGLYYCLNFTTNTKDKPEAVLIRALEPVQGIEIMKKNRSKQHKKELCSGPGKLAQALLIDLKVNGTKVGEKINLIEGIKVEKVDIVSTPRIGISQAKDWPLRYYIKNNQYISKK